MEAEIINHPSGYTFKYDPATASHANLSGLNCMGALLENLQFKDSETMQNVIDGLELWAEAPEFRSRKVDAGYVMDIVRTGNSDAEVMEALNKYFGAAVSDDSKEIYVRSTGEHLSTPSGEYNLVQNRDLFQGMKNAYDALELEAKGRIDVREKGYTVGYGVLMSEEHTINILEQYNEPMGYVAQITNSPAGQKGVTFNVDGIFGICSNFCVWGLPQLRTSMKHSCKDVVKMGEDIEMYLKTIAENSPQLVKLCSDAESVPLDRSDLEMVLWGVSKPKKLSIKMMDAIVANPEQFNVRMTDRSPVGKLDLTQFQAYMCATNAITFKQTKGLQSTLAELEAATQLLTMKQDKLIERGVENFKNYAEQLKAQKELRLEKQNALREVIPAQ